MLIFQGLNHLQRYSLQIQKKKLNTSLETVKYPFNDHIPRNNTKKNMSGVG